MESTGIEPARAEPALAEHMRSPEDAGRFEPAPPERVDAGPANAHPADAESADGEHADVDGALPGRPHRSRTRAGAWLGILAVVFAVACAGLVVAGVAVALAGDFTVSTLLAQLAIGCSIAAIVSGVVAIVRGSGRGWGIAGCVLGILANPLVAVVVLRTFDGI